MSYWVGKLPLLFHPYKKGERNHYSPFQQSLPYHQRSRLRSLTSQICKCPKSLLSLDFLFCLFIRMSRFDSLVNTPEMREAFKAKYNILARVEIEHCHLGKWYTKRPTGAIVIPMIAFIECGMQIPMGRVTKDFLISIGLTPPSALQISLGY